MTEEVVSMYTSFNPDHLDLSPYLQGQALQQCSWPVQAMLQGVIHIP